MDPRILAAAMAVLVVLGGGTLLAAQVQSDLEQGVKELARPYERPGDTPPLKLNEFKLPRELPMEIPPGTEVSPDLSKLKLPRDLDLAIPDDLDLSGLNFELPEDFDLQLPEGTIFSPPGLQLPNGGTIRLPDGREFVLPHGTKLDLPPELVERLLAQGVPAGRLNAPRSVDVRDLPPELTARLDPPSFEGGGRLRLPAGTTITLPDGRLLPFAAGALPYVARYVLPAGTTFDIPFSAQGTQQGVFPVPRPNSATQLDPAAARAPPPLDTEITSYPSRVRKGEPITVSGYVRDMQGNPVAGAPVDVFMNETKRAPGVLVGQGTSDARGIFVVTLRLPEDKPAREYQLVNHAVAFTDASGRAWGDGWGDPPFATYASTSIRLDLPARDGFGSSTAIAGTLLDHTGAPVVGATVAILVDGATVARPVTNAQGRFSTAHTFPAGTHAVEARFGGSTSYEASFARGEIAIDDFAIEVVPTLRAKLAS
ncbi:MAG TPA: carboxypeptidase regulatory-like domain-containing protein [Candidatus Thermoplasmatota archaeon]|nr:carboxypeptidase regulatory-like domain-containing protein [Candidatus Thermoplasmatota archaeon]